MFARKFAPALVFVAFGAGIAHAEVPVRIDQFDHWGAYSYKSGDSVNCYVLSRPVAQQPANVDHGDNFFIVSRLSSGDKLVPEAAMGYDPKDGAPMTAMVGDKTFPMFTKDRHAWVKDETQEPTLVSAMKGGAQLQLQATSKRGTATSYSYSLSGITAALKRIETCK
ncbi:hypothetical protein GR212_05285 [Rhizobium lusitanum]|uniref:Uncharacterized protein n=1 Tax=Rhizobium lusitanum TaxID=293958 RepID=A0A6L9U3A1_9HYPH|nr:invasion associated locus B family protein [Rhizobium lusitanum]NEI68978.1 hypothetical protein [Rhizobium lusitanum]